MYFVEIWKDVVGYEGCYKVSNKGRVKTVARDIVDKRGRPFHIKENIKTPQDNGRGYMSVQLYKNNKQHIVYVHRLVATAFIPNPYYKPTVNHKDKNTKNNSVENLEWCTYKENEKHKWTYKPKGVSENTRKAARKRMLSKNNPSKINPPTRGKNGASKKIICNGQIFECIKDFAEHYKVSRGTASRWVNSKNIPRSKGIKELKFVN